ncbi:DUF1365 domain-containing protein [Oceaniglobus ichthyenteri]|uniref:DUF1365 domain-containing protein n=1 Tax=Oceaniglobus ichthyenteri TaxID=2136177 RepID=UPI000D379B81|nr:DUF1365 domain-containing protein [Oceaniglobus ichthyenteri]
MSGRVDHIDGVTYHGRRGAVENAFRYSIDYVLFEPEAKPAWPSLFRRNRRGLAGFYDADHGGAPGKGRGAPWVRDVLAAHNLHDMGRIELLTQPRVLGHVFNPVSFWLIYQGDALTVVIAEVTNTFGDRHSYLCHHPDLRPITAQDTLEAQKIFHVSPFQDVTGSYSFRFDIRPDKIGVWIDYRAGNGGMLATLTGPRRPLSNATILRSCLRRPFGSRRVLALIHWQALKLWIKRAGYRPRPEPPQDEVSR